MKSLGNVFLVIAAIPLVAFPPIYHFTTGGQWRKSQIGRHLMSFMGVLGAVIVLACAGQIFKPLPDFFRPLVWSAIAFVSWQRLWLLLKAQRPQKATTPDA